MIKCEKGFSLVELLIAMAIISIVVAFSVALFSQSVDSIYYSGNVSEKIFDAQTEIEGFNTTPVSLTITIDFPDIDDEGIGEEDIPLAEMNVEVYEAYYEHRNRSSALYYFLPVVEGEEENDE